MNQIEALNTSYRNFHYSYGMLESWSTGVVGEKREIIMFFSFKPMTPVFHFSYTPIGTKPLSSPA